MKIQNDGTVEVDVERSATVASELLELQSFEESTVSGSFISDSKKLVPRLQIVILVVGTRGDVQPFVAIAKRLKACLSISFQFTLIHWRIAPIYLQGCKILISTTVCEFYIMKVSFVEFVLPYVN